MKSVKRNPHREAISPIRAGLNALQKEVEAAAEALGYDTSNKDWRKHLREEGDLYPICTANDNDRDLVSQLPKRARARLRAREIIDSFSDLLPYLEETVVECDRWRAELSRTLAIGPSSMPITIFVKQLEEVE